jgi:hypothetical protein
MVATGLVAVNADPKNGDGPKPGIDFNGPHFNLNLIGKNKEMPGDYLDTDRHTMFVPLETPVGEDGIALHTPNNLEEEYLDGVKIEITQGTEFLVLDGDATDGYGALQLGPDKYHVYIAVKAKSPKYDNPETTITGWVEAYDNAGQLWYYIDVGTYTVSKAKNKWTDATGILFVDTDEDFLDYIEWHQANIPVEDQYTYVPHLGFWVFDYMTGLDECTGLINPATGLPYDFEQLAYFWQLVNSGNKLIQVRFYPMG